MTSAEAWFNIGLRPRKPEGSLGRTAQDGHLDSHTAPELCGRGRTTRLFILLATNLGVYSNTEIGASPAILVRFCPSVRIGTLSSRCLHLNVRKHGMLIVIHDRESE